MALYEAVFIARQDLTAENVDALSDKLSDIITTNNGKIVGKEYWGLRNLSYKINKNPRGHYFCLNIESANEGINELKRVCGINEDVIRSAIIKVEKHSGELSALAVSEKAKGYKPSDSDKKAETKISSEIKKVVINF